MPIKHVSTAIVGSQRSLAQDIEWTCVLSGQCRAYARTRESQQNLKEVKMHVSVRWDNEAICAKIELKQQAAKADGLLV